MPHAKRKPNTMRCALRVQYPKGQRTENTPITLCCRNAKVERCARPATRVKILSRARYSRHAWCLAGARPPRSSRAISGYLSSRGSRRSFRRQVRLGLACGLASAQVVVSSVFQVISRPPRVISSRQVNGYLERAHSGYLERSGYLEGGVGATWASRWLGPFRMTLDSVRSGDDSVRTSDTRETRHPTFPASTLYKESVRGRNPWGTF